MYIEQKQDRILKPHSVYTKSAEEDNQITTELLNLITEAGLTPSADDLTQVKAAVLSLGGGGSGHVVGEIVSSTLPITDAGFHLLDGALISGSGTYAAFVDYIGDLYDGGSYSGLFETEANWQAAVTAYGVCGKFVYDSVNNTVRLPKITGIIEGTTDTTALGDLVAAGLPNITGGFYVRDQAVVEDGALYRDSSKTAGGYYGADSASALAGMMLDASRSSSIYGNSATVQPQTIKILYYICIATTIKTDIQADIDQIASDLNLIASDLNGKAETDLSNLTAAGDIYGSKLYAPSSVSEAVTIGSSGADYTAPSNGWVYAQGTQTSSGGWIALVSSSGIISRAQTSYNNSIHNIYIPVQKGDTFQLHWTNVGSKSLTFVYAEGSKTEAN